MSMHVESGHNHVLSILVYFCLCMCGCRYTYVLAYMNRLIWRPEDNPAVFLYHLYLILLERVSFTWSFSCRFGWLANEPKGSAGLHVLSARLSLQCLSCLQKQKQTILICLLQLLEDVYPTY